MILLQVDSIDKVAIMNKLRILLSFFIFIGGFLFFHKEVSAQNFVVNPNQTYTYTKMIRDIEKLEKAYPELIDVEIIGQSEYGRDIYAVSLGKGDSTVFINGSHHAREWITTNVNMNMIDKYANAYEKNSRIDGYDVQRILNNTTIWFIPMVNPDGVTLQQTGLSSFPKADHAKIIKMNDGSRNFKRWKANAKGIDLNRQYDAKWKSLKSGGNVPKFKNYKGKSPESASETKAVLNFVNEINPEIAISYHSSGQILFWKYGQTGSRYTRDRNYIRKISQMTGYRLISPNSWTGGGGFSDWYSGVQKKPAFTIEVAPYAGESQVPLKYFKKIWRENEGIGLYVAQEGAKLYDNRQLAKTNAVIKEIKSLNAKAKTLQTYYDTGIKNESQLKITKAQTNLYNETVKEIKRQEKNIAKLPADQQQSANAWLKTSKTYRDRYEDYQAAIKAGDTLADSHKAFVTSVQAGELSASTVKDYAQLEKEIDAVEVKIKNMATNKVRTLATEKYLQPVKNDIAAIDNILARYQLLVMIDQKITNKEDPVEDWTEFEKLKQQAPTHEAYELAEQFLLQWQESLQQAHSAEIPATEEDAANPEADSAA